MHVRPPRSLDPHVSDGRSSVGTEGLEPPRMLTPRSGDRHEFSQLTPPCSPCPSHRSTRQGAPRRRVAGHDEVRLAPTTERAHRRTVPAPQEGACRSPCRTSHMKLPCLNWLLRPLPDGGGDLRSQPSGESPSRIRSRLFRGASGGDAALGSPAESGPCGLVSTETTGLRLRVSGARADARGISAPTRGAPGHGDLPGGRRRSGVLRPV
jgi:hypothetical protein